MGTLLFWITPFKAGQALAMAFIAGAGGTLGERVMAALYFAASVFFHSVRGYFQLEL